MKSLLKRISEIITKINKTNRILKRILYIILLLFASIQENATAQIGDCKDSVQVRAQRVSISDSIAPLMRAKPLLCVVDTTTLTNAFVVREQYRGFVFDGIPENLSRRKMNKILKNNDWYVCYDPTYFGFLLNPYYYKKYGEWIDFIEEPKVDLHWIKRDNWLVGKFTNPNQLFLVVLINVELLNMNIPHIDWISDEDQEKKYRRDYPSFNPQASYVKMLLPIRRGKGLPL